METIFKYTLNLGDTSVEMPIGSEVIHCDTQNEQICIWVVVDVNASTETRSFTVYGTGHAMDDNPKKHIGSCYMQEGALVWHIFENLFV